MAPKGEGPNLKIFSRVAVTWLKPEDCFTLPDYKAHRVIWLVQSGL